MDRAQSRVGGHTEKDISLPSPPSLPPSALFLGVRLLALLCVAAARTEEEEEVEEEEEEEEEEDEEEEEERRDFSKQL